MGLQAVSLIVGPPAADGGAAARTANARNGRCHTAPVSDGVVELAAIERGAGPAVTLVHGGVFHSGPGWARNIGPLVQEGYRVIAVDRRGYGRSPDGGPGPVSVAQQAGDVAATLDLREVEATHVVGVSYGALVALELALAEPVRVRSLTMVEPVIFSWLADDPDYAPWFDRFCELETLGAAGVPPETWLEPWLALMDPQMAADLRPGAPSWPLVERALGRVGIEERVSSYQPDPAALSGLETPALVVNGADTEPALRAVGDILVDRLPVAEHVEVAGAGHQLHAQRAASFNKLLVTFLSLTGEGAGA